MRILLKHPTIMYDAIEEMNHKNQRYIKEVELAINIRQYCKSLNKVEKKRLAIAFNTDNLYHANIITNIDKRDNERVLLFHDAILMLFRLCEASLYQEITDAKLQSRIASLRDARNRLETSSFFNSDPDYLELTEDILEQLSNLLGMLRTNVIAMQRINEKLENMTATVSKSPQDFTAYRKTLFQKITYLFDRHIKPILNFLDPEIRLKDGSNLFKTIKQIETKYRSENKQDIAIQIFRYSMSLTSTYKPIQKIARQVDHFLRKTRMGIIQFNAMESQYQKLKKLYQKTQQSNLSISYMDGSNFSKSNNFVLGLRKQARLKAYQFGSSISYYENLFSEIQLRLSLNKVTPTDLNINGESYFKEKSDDRLQRIELLYQWLQQQSFRPTNDMVATVHYRLYEWLDDYSFPDLLIAINKLDYKTDWDYKLITTNHYSFISIDNQSFIYRRCRLEIAEDK